MNRDVFFRWVLFFGVVPILLMSQEVDAKDLILQHGIEQWILSEELQQSWVLEEEILTPQRYSGESDSSASSMLFLDEGAIAQFLQEEIAPEVEVEVSHAVIQRDPESGEVQFQGAARDGVKLNVEHGVRMVSEAIRRESELMQVPIYSVSAEVQVLDEELQQSGIQELIGVGVSDFSGSPWSRVHNIRVGAERFQGYTIPQGEEANFNEQLGSVTAAQGYLNEKVILGNKIEKAMGGGICQVSTTAFRAALLSGLPITERWNHSFAVTYYAPQGTDATIWIGGKNLRWQNDTPGDILVQTVMDEENAELRFHFYGTSDQRSTRIVQAERSLGGGFLTAGQANSLARNARGFDASIVRAVERPDAPNSIPAVENFQSRYRTKPPDVEINP